MGFLRPPPKKKKKYEKCHCCYLSLCLLVIFIAWANKDLQLWSVSDEQINEYSPCAGRLNRTTDDLVCVSELHCIIGSSPSVNTIIYLGLQTQHLLQTDKNTHGDLLNLHGCCKKQWVDYWMCVDYKRERERDSEATDDKADFDFNL